MLVCGCSFELDLWGAILNITLLVLLASYLVWHAKYIPDSFSWKLLQWLVIILIVWNFAAGPLADFVPMIPTIDQIVVAVENSIYALWDWFYASATTV